MSGVTIELDGVALPLPEDAELAITYQAMDIRKVSARSGYYAESLSLPNTALTRRVLMNSHLVTSGTIQPYRYIPTVIKHSGNPVLTGRAAHTEAGATFTMDVDGGNADLFALVKDKKLADIDLSDLDHTWTNANVTGANSHDPERGYLYPLINYGRLTGRTLAAGNVRFDELYPAVYVRTLLERMLTPYTLTGSLLMDQRFQKLILPFCNEEFRYREAYRAGFDVSLQKVAAMVAPVGPVLLPISFEAGSNPLNYYTSDHYAAPVVGNYQVKARISLTTYNASAVNNSIRIQLLRLPASGPGSTLVVEQVITLDGAQEANIDEAVTNIQPGERLGIYVLTGSNASADINPNSTLEIGLINRVVSPGPVQLDANLPELSQADLLLTVLNEFNVMVQANPVTQTVRLDSLERMRWTTPVDWSRKIDWTTPPTFTFALNGYAQDNYLTYSENEETRESPGTLTDQAIISTGNSRLEQEATLYASPFVATEALPAFKGAVTLPYIPVWQQEWQSFSLWSAYTAYRPDEWVIWNGEYYKAIAESTSAVPDQQPLKWLRGTEAEVFTRLSPKPRLLVVEERPVGQHIFVGADYNPATNTTLYTSASFAPISWEELVAAYHGITRDMLQQARIMKARFRLKLPDISMLDFLRPVVLNVPERNLQGAFYLNAVNQFRPDRPGQSTEVELVRLFGMPIPETGTPATTAKKEFSHEFSAEFN